jgi:hypothetical protein
MAAFVPSTFGAPGGGLPENPYQVGGQPALGLLKTPEQRQQEEEQGNSPNLQQAYDTYQKFAGTTPAATSAAPAASGGSSLVTGSLGSASYAPTGFGLAGASQGLTYGGSATLGAGGSLIGTSGGAATAASTGGTGFGLGGSLVGGSGAVGGSTFAAGGASGGASGGAAAGGSAAGGLASAGPWAALIAAIGLNENYQKKTGNREMSHEKQLEHALTGKVVEDDASVWGEKIDSGNDLGIKGDMEVGSDFATGDFSNAFKNLDETFGIKTIKKLFGG